VKRSDPTLHLSEHHGDATPGFAVFIPVADIAALQQELLAKEFKYAKSSIETADWGRVMQIMDPFGNCLRFCELSKD
jgi:predicted enzyme related to lactoylglutathione lyase